MSNRPLFSIFWYFDHHECLLKLEGLPLQGWSAPRESYPSAGSEVFKCKAMNLESEFLTTFSVELLLRVRITPGPSTRQPGTAVIPQLLLKVSKSASHNLPSLLPPFLPTETTIKALILSPILTEPGAPLCPPPPLPGGCASPLLLGSVSNQLSFQWQWSPGLLALLSLNDNKTPKSKQRLHGGGDVWGVRCVKNIWKYYLCITRQKIGF